jgi:hypothetical protein
MPLSSALKRRVMNNQTEVRKSLSVSSLVSHVFTVEVRVVASTVGLLEREAEVFFLSVVAWKRDSKAHAVTL